MIGDPSLFSRADEAELAWGIIDPLQKTWEAGDVPHLNLYEPGAWGPPVADDWMEQQGRAWFDVCPVMS
jgi:glucose-6-phosphate 1-dehydrogenase